MHMDALMTWEKRRPRSRSFLPLLFFRFEVAPAYRAGVIRAALPGDKLLSPSKVQQRIQPKTL